MPEGHRVDGRMFIIEFAMLQGTILVLSLLTFDKNSNLSSTITKRPRGSYFMSFSADYFLVSSTSRGLQPAWVLKPPRCRCEHPPSPLGYSHTQSRVTGFALNVSIFFSIDGSCCFVMRWFRISHSFSNILTFLGRPSQLQIFTFTNFPLCNAVVHWGNKQWQA